MKSTSGRSIEQLSGAAPRGAPSGPSTNERHRLGPERPPVPGGPRWSPRRGGGPGTAPVRWGRHFTRGKEKKKAGCCLSRPRLFSVFRKPGCHSNLQSFSVSCEDTVESELGGDWVTQDCRDSAPRTTFPTLECVRSFLPGKTRRDTLSPVPPAWKPCPTKPGERRASSPCAFHPPWIPKHQLVHHPNDADPFMRRLSCQPLGSAISALSLRRLT